MCIGGGQRVVVHFGRLEVNSLDFSLDLVPKGLGPNLFGELTSPGGTSRGYCLFLARSLRNASNVLSQSCAKIALFNFFGSMTRNQDDKASRTWKAKTIFRQNSFFAFQGKLAERCVSSFVS